jgi:hypothetical protein
VDLHANYTPTFMALANEYLQSPTNSINNPIWFSSDLYDETAFTIDDGLDDLLNSNFC